MSAERDAGLQALQQGNSSAAVPLLETACQQNPGDFDAHLFLGAAYGQVGRQMEAIHAITHAVQIQPANAQARYNLAVAMEQGGYTEQAVTALRQALTLQPGYPKAEDALRRLEGDHAAAVSGGAAASPANPAGTPASPATIEPTQSDPLEDSRAAPGVSDPVSAGTSALPQFGFGQVSDSPGGDPTSQMPAYNPQAATQRGYSAAPPAAADTPLYGAPPQQPGASGAYNATGAAGGYAASPPEAYGSPPPGAYSAPPPPPYGGAAPAPYAAPGMYAAPGATPYAPPPSPYPTAPMPGPYAGPGAAGAYGGNSPYAESRRRSADYDDSFNIVAAAKAWGSMIVRPAPFLREMAGSSGLLAPLALALLYLIPLGLGVAIQNGRMSGQFSRAMSGFGPVFAGGGMLLMVLIGLPIMLLGMFLMAWILHLIGRAFGNRSPYSSSFRALVFSYAPVPILQLIGSLAPVGETYPFNPVAILLGLVGFLWGTVLLCMAISTQQEIDAGPAIGVVLLSYIALGMLYFGVVFVVFILAVVIGMAAAGSHSMIPFR